MSTELKAGVGDDRDIVSILKSELDFLEKGGYGRSVRTPWLSTSIFQDSPSCFCFPFHEHNDACVLMQFVPPERRAEVLPCHHIPLNKAGDTVTLLEYVGTQGETEDLVKSWLREKIAAIQRERMETGFDLDLTRNARRPE